MKYVLLSLILFASVSLIGISQESYAEIEQGANYDKQVLQEYPDGSQKIKNTLYLYDRILDGNQYKDYIFSETEYKLKITTSYGFVELDKTSCAFNFNDKFTDSIIAFNSIVDLYDWQTINQINNATCEAYYDIGNKALVAKRYASGIGFMEYKYIFFNGAWKTQLEATNLTSLTDRVFAFDQTIDLNRDSIKWAGETKNLDNFSGQVFDRTFLENNETKLLNLLNGFNYDLDLGFNYLDSISVTDTGTNKSKLVFHFMRNNEILSPNETLIIDPTFTASSPSNQAMMTDNSDTDTCDSSPSSVTLSSGDDVGVYSTGTTPEDCVQQIWEFDITSLPDSANISQVQFDFGVASYVGTPENCDIYGFTVDYAAGAAAIWTDSVTSSVYLNNDATCTTTGDKSVTLGSTANTELQAEALSGDNEWMLGIRYDSFYGRATDGSSHNTKLKTFPTIVGSLTVTYTVANNPDKVTDLTSTSISQTTVNFDWSAPYAGGGGQTIIGYQVNVTNPQTNNPLVFLNDTGSTNSDYLATGLTLGTSYSARVSAWTNNTGEHPLNNATGNVYNFTTSTFNPPGAPTLSATALSDTAIRYISVPGTAGHNATLWYGLRCELNGAGSWTTIISNSSYVSFYEYTGLTLGDVNICQWRDGSVDGFGAYSNNATADLFLAVLQSQRTSEANPDDKLIAFIEMVTNYGGVYFGLGAVPFGVMLIGFMAGKKTVRIFTIATLFLMGIIHASGYFVYPDWYWTLCLLFGIILVMGRMKSD